MPFKLERNDRICLAIGYKGQLEDISEHPPLDVAVGAMPAPAFNKAAKHLQNLQDIPSWTEHSLQLNDYGYYVWAGPKEADKKLSLIFRGRLRIPNAFFRLETLLRQHEGPRGLTSESIERVEKLLRR